MSSVGLLSLSALYLVQIFLIRQVIDYHKRSAPFVISLLSNIADPCCSCKHIFIYLSLWNNDVNRYFGIRHSFRFLSCCEYPQARAWTCFELLLYKQLPLGDWVSLNAFCIVPFCLMYGSSLRFICRLVCFLIVPRLNFSFNILNYFHWNVILSNYCAW